MLEDHLIPFIRKWGAPCGFHGEQGGQSIHKTINSMKHNYSNVKNNVERLTYVMHNHLADTNPNTRANQGCQEEKTVTKRHNLTVKWCLRCVGVWAINTCA